MDQKPVWVDLARLCIQFPGRPDHLNAAGLDMSGEVPGTLRRWLPTIKGDWMAVVDLDIAYADGREPERLQGQLIPGYALRPRPAS